MRLFITILICLLSLQVSAQKCTLKLAGIDACPLKTVDLKDILRDPKLTCDDTTGQIIHYSVSVYINEKMEVDGPYHVKGPQLSQEVINMLKRYVGYSGMFYIDDLKIIGPDKRTRTWFGVAAKFPR